MVLPKRSTGIVPVLLILLISFSCGGKEHSGSTESYAPKASISAYQASENEVRFLIQVPAGHHAYLDKGDDDVLIPVTFYWDDLVKSGEIKKVPELKEGPRGERDEDVGARVLRGTGTFIFTGESLSQTGGKSIRIRTQICDEEKGMCYRPVTAKVLIKTDG